MSIFRYYIGLYSTFINIYFDPIGFHVSPSPKHNTNYLYVFVVTDLCREQQQLVHQWRKLLHIHILKHAQDLLDHMTQLVQWERHIFKHGRQVDDCACVPSATHDNRQLVMKSVGNEFPLIKLTLMAVLSICKSFRCARNSSASKSYLSSHYRILLKVITWIVQTLLMKTSKPVWATLNEIATFLSTSCWGRGSCTRCPSWCCLLTGPRHGTPGQTRSSETAPVIWKHTGVVLWGGLFILEKRVSIEFAVPGYVNFNVHAIYMCSRQGLFIFLLENQ